MGRHKKDPDAPDVIPPPPVIPYDRELGMIVNAGARGFGSSTCPHCGGSLNTWGGWSYCPRCGQRLAWA